MVPRTSDLSIFWPWLQKQNRHQEFRFKHFLALAPNVDEMGPRRFDLHFPALAPKVDKIGPRTLDLSIFWFWLQGNQEVRFKHFLALAPEVDKMGPWESDLSIFWFWLQYVVFDVAIYGCHVKYVVFYIAI